MSKREAGHLGMKVNGVFMSGIYLGYLQYGAAVEVRTSEFCDDYRLVTPLRGPPSRNFRQE